ncbi:MAG TPA: histidine phosphatase family protein [Streptosporangiaceae bacterium]|nr:histidine phosphatase family protein [Streptosporangiaceae bacterium]
MASDQTRQLILLRHAKSDWPDVPDQDRPLAKRGRRDAPRIGRWLHEHGYQPDVAVVSAAARTRQTWDLVAPELGGSPAVRFEPRAYAASALTLLYLVQELPERYRTALLIAHNPGLSELATSLAAPAAGPAAPAGTAAPAGAPVLDPAGNGLRPVISMPTAAVAVFEFPGDWPTLTPGHARLISLTTPADL